eukprot:8627815-Heterocapsa_arctica.AAC.1
MSTAPKEDHRFIAAHVDVHIAEQTAKGKRDIAPGRTWFNTDNMHDPMMQREFAKMMWQVDPSTGCMADAHLDELTSHIKASARK